MNRSQWTDGPLSHSDGNVGAFRKVSTGLPSSLCAHVTRHSHLHHGRTSSGRSPDEWQCDRLHRGHPAQVVEASTANGGVTIRVRALPLAAPLARALSDAPDAIRAAADEQRGRPQPAAAPCPAAAAASRDCRSQPKHPPHSGGGTAAQGSPGSAAAGGAQPGDARSSRASASDDDAATGAVDAAGMSLAALAVSDAQHAAGKPAELAGDAGSSDHVTSALAALRGRCLPPRPLPAPRHASCAVPRSSATGPNPSEARPGGARPGPQRPAPATNQSNTAAAAPARLLWVPSLRYFPEFDVCTASNCTIACVDAGGCCS